MFSNLKKEHDPEYDGEKPDPLLDLGPRETRGCTNCLCLIFFLGFFAGMIIISIYGFSEGNYSRLSSPFDSDGKYIQILFFNLINVNIIHFEKSYITSILKLLY